MGFSMDATSVAISLGNEFDGRLLKADETYYVRGFPLQPVFHIPTIKAGDEVRVRLVLDDDRIKAPASAATSQAPKIVVRGHVDSPDLLKVGTKLLRVAYIQDGKGAWWPIEPDGSFVGEVSSLGGELGIYDIGTPGALTSLFYSSALTKNDPVFPAAADFVGGTNRVRPLMLELGGVTLPEGAVAAGCLASDKSRLPLCTRPLTPGLTQVEILVPNPLADTVLFIGDKRGGFFRCEFDGDSIKDGHVRIKSFKRLDRSR